MTLVIFIFLLAAFLGFELITKIPSQLHTPLMSGANAISGVTLVGAITAVQLEGTTIGIWLAAVAVALAAVNVVGGYLVTDRMLQMFRGKKKPQGGTGKS